jgi:hypothetical protein
MVVALVLFAASGVPTNLKRVLRLDLVRSAALLHEYSPTARPTAICDAGAGTDGRPGTRPHVERDPADRISYQGGPAG